MNWHHAPTGSITENIFSYAGALEIIGAVTLQGRGTVRGYQGSTIISNGMSATLINVDNILDFDVDTIGDANLTLINEAHGTIKAGGIKAADINNAGTIAVSNDLFGRVTNSGTIKKSDPYNYHNGATSVLTWIIRDV